MPLYEYQCDACGRRFEVIQKFSDPPVNACTACGQGPVTRLPSAPAIQFKGAGWYITDYARKGATETEKDQTPPAQRDGTTGESGKADGAKAEAGQTRETEGERTKEKKGAGTGKAFGDTASRTGKTPTAS